MRNLTRQSLIAATAERERGGEGPHPGVVTALSNSRTHGGAGAQNSLAGERKPRRATAPGGKGARAVSRSEHMRTAGRWLPAGA